MTVNVTLRGNFDVLKNRYFMVIATQESFSVPIPPPEGSSLDEFLQPGDPPIVGTIDPYFTNYYSTWHSFIVFGSTGYLLSKGPYLSTATPSLESLAPFTTTSNKISFTVRLEQVFGSSIPDTIYFDIVSANYGSGEQKFLKDHIYPPVRSIKVISGSILEKTDEVTTGVDPSLDIIDWWVQIQ